MSRAISKFILDGRPGNMDTRSPPERVVIVIICQHGCDGQSTRVYEQALPYVRRWPCRNMWTLAHLNAWTWSMLLCLRIAGHLTQICDEHAQTNSAQQLPLEVLDVFFWRLKVRILCVFDRNSQRIRLMKTRRYSFSLMRAMSLAATKTSRGPAWLGSNVCVFVYFADEYAIRFSDTAGMSQNACKNVWRGTSVRFEGF